MKTRSFLLAAGVLLAMAFTFSCDSGGGGGSGTQGGGGSSSSGGPGPGGGNSSSGGGNNPGGGGYTGPYGSVSHGGKTYKTVVIGTQTWMAENLDYDPGTGNSACYDNQESNCATYGRLYDWSTAMGLPSSCDDNSCSSQIQSKHRGICPSGWHLPSDDEWTVLTDYVGSTTKLRAKSGWSSGNGTDDYGFSALPGGNGVSGSYGYFDNVGYYGYWWCATERSRGFASYRGTPQIFSEGMPTRAKSSLFSVRCLQD